MCTTSVFVRISSFILMLFAFFYDVSSDKLVFVVGETSSLKVTPRREVMDSSGKTSICERIQVHGLKRINHIDKYAHSLKLMILSSNTSNILTTPIDVCFHRNSSRAIGMCPYSQWENITNGLWVGLMSPFDHKIIDIRISDDVSTKVTLEVSIKQEFFMYRIVFLIMGIMLLSLASKLSISLAFYYIGAMSIGVTILVALIINKGMKRLPRRGKSVLELFLYSFIVGVGGYFLNNLRGFIKHLLMEIGISEDLYFLVAILFGAFVFLLGAWSGFWTVKKFLLAKDGSIEITATIFVSWSIRVFAIVLILQSSLDPLLAGGALLFGIIITLILKSISKRFLSQVIYKKDDGTKNCSHATAFASPLPRGINKKSRKTVPLSDSETFPSSFHKTSEGRRKLTKEELDKFTRDSTEKAVKELVCSPGFGEWAVQNAKRISVNSIKDSSR